MDDVSMNENKPRRRWLSFGIRDLFWTMVVVCMASGWFSDRVNLGKDVEWQRKTAKGELHRLRENLVYLEQQREKLEQKLRECRELHSDDQTSSNTY